MKNIITSYYFISMDMQKTVLNILTSWWINPNGKLFQKLICEGYRYVNRLSDYLKDIRITYICKFELDSLADFYYSALILPLSVLTIRVDIRKKFIISVESAVMEEMSLFTLEKNKWTLLQNLIQINYFIDNLTTLIKITWKQEEMKTWRNDVFIKFLHHSNLAPSKHRPGALYDAFTKSSVLGPEHILALVRI